MLTMPAGPVCPYREHTPVPSAPATYCFGGPRKTNGSPAKPGSHAKSQLDSNALMRAFRKQGYQNHQIRKREQPLIGADAGRFRCPGDEAQMTALRKIVHMLDANTRQAGDLRISENLLARLHGNHGPAPLFRRKLPYTYFDAVGIVSAALSP